MGLLMPNVDTHTLLFVRGKAHIIYVHNISICIYRIRIRKEFRSKSMYLYLLNEYLGHIEIYFSKKKPNENLESTKIYKKKNTIDRGKSSTS